MKATRLDGSPTLYSVTSEKRLRCSKIGCHFQSEAKKYTWGEPCPTCFAAATASSDLKATVGTLELCSYQVDLSDYHGVGTCSCERGNMEFLPRIRLIPPQHLLVMTDDNLNINLRCKHVRCAWLEAGKPDNLRALILALPAQQQENTP